MGIFKMAHLIGNAELLLTLNITISHFNLIGKILPNCVCDYLYLLNRVESLAQSSVCFF
jgi:hypothetical protein